MIRSSVFADRSAARFVLKLATALLCAWFWQATLLAAEPVAPSIPTEKGWCCDSYNYGVLDLSGSWRGVNLHNPSLFGNLQFLYEDTGSSGQSLFNIKLLSQSISEVLVGGGQQVTQTYSGKLIQTWYELPNVKPETCLVSPQATRSMCEYVRRTANYDVIFSVAWCKHTEGFSFYGVISTETILKFTDSGLSVADRMVIDPPAGPVCPGVPGIAPTSVVIDLEGELLNLGLTPGAQLLFTEPGVHPYDILEFKLPDRDGCWCEGGGTNYPEFSFGKKLGAADIIDLRGDVLFTITSDMPLDLIDPPFRPLGDITLLKQNGKVRAQQVDETDIEYQAYLETIKDAFTFVSSTPEYDEGVYRFEDVPQYDVITVNGREVVRPARYSVRLRGLNVEENIPGAIPPATQFTLFSGAHALNVQTGVAESLVVTPLDGIPIKKRLINELKGMSPTNYLAPENLALNQVNALEAGSPTDSQLEGLKRAILAERVARDGGRFGELQIKGMLTGLEKVMSLLIADLFSKVGTGKNLKEKKKVLSKIDDSVDPSVLVGDGWNRVPANLATIKDSRKKLIDDNTSLKVSLVAEKIKSLLGFTLSMLKGSLVVAGVPEETADLVSRAIAGVVNTVLDVAISQGVGGLESAAQEAVKIAIANAQNDLFDVYPNSYTDVTLEAVEFSQQQFVGWTTDNDIAYRKDRSETEQELVRMGIDAYETLGTSNAASIVSDGFDKAEAALGFLDKFPLAKIAKAVSKVGKYLTSAVAFAVPLRGAYWDTPARVRAGVAKAYGQSPDVVFPLPSPDGQGQGVALPNGLGTPLVQAFRATLNQIRTRMSNLKSEWAVDDVEDVLDIVSGDDLDDFPALFAQYELQLSDLLAMSAAHQGDSITAVQMQGSFTRASIGMDVKIAEVKTEQLELLSQIFDREFTGPADPRYLASKAAMSGRLDGLSNTAKILRLAADEFRAVMASQPFNSAVVVREATLTSDSTALNEVTLANEIFTLSTSIRNLGLSTVTGVEAELTLPLASPVSILSTAIQPAGSGALVPNDNVPGSGTDEAMVTWQVQYTGPIDDQTNIPFVIETRSTTVDDPGKYNTGFVVLTVDPEIFDPDGDGMPTAWESANSLNPEVDDGEQDADSDDLANAEEFDRGTKPQIADSDEDGIDDGDEVAGVNGWITDPADEDTDDDGVLDGADGSPLDPTTSEALPGFEPIVTVSSNLLALDEETQQVIVDVTNSGTGPLVWTAVSNNPSLIMTGSGVPTVETGTSLLLQLAPGVDVAANDGATVEIVVTDVAGADTDTQTIVVAIGEIPDQPEEIYEDGFEAL